jgi:hypothetical protein
VFPRLARVLQPEGVRGRDDHRSGGVLLCSTSLCSILTAIPVASQVLALNLTPNPFIAKLPCTVRFSQSPGLLGIHICLRLLKKRFRPLTASAPSHTIHDQEEQAAWLS